MFFPLKIYAKIMIAKKKIAPWFQNLWNEPSAKNEKLNTTPKGGIQQLRTNFSYSYLPRAKHWSYSKDFLN